MRPTAFVALLLYMALGIGVALPMAWPVLVPTRMAVIAHSGDVSLWPRDSLPAITAAAGSPADGVEFDVNRSSDGTWWLAHDADLTASTTGSGSIWTTTDLEMAALRINGGMGFDPARQADLLPVPRLTDVLDQLQGYGGTLIVDCKDSRPGAHRDLALLLASRGLYPSIIARHADGAAEVKAVDRRFTVITQLVQTLDPNVDVWLASATVEVAPPRTTWADLVGDVGMFVDAALWRQDERPLLDNGRRWGMHFVITNDIAAALAWRGEQQ